MALAAQLQLEAQVFECVQGPIGVSYVFADYVCLCGNLTRVLSQLCELLGVVLDLCPMVQSSMQ